MNGTFDLAAFDDDFAARTPPDDWARILKFRNYPRFLDGVRRHEGVMQPFFAHNFFLNKVVWEVWRFQILVMILYLHATRDEIDPRTGLTLANLHKLCAQLQLASPGRVTAYVNIMKIGGYLTAERSILDNRLVQMKPTPEFMTIVEDWNDNIFACVDAANPEGNLSSLRARYPGIGVGMRNSGAEGLLEGWKPMDAFPEVFHFATVDGGWLLMEHIVADSMREPGKINIRPVRVKLGVLSNQFGGSRSNLRRVLEKGYEKGLLAEPPLGGAHIVFTPRMICSFITFLASFLGYFEKHTAIALARLRGAQAG